MYPTQSCRVQSSAHSGVLLSSVQLGAGQEYCRSESDVKSSIAGASYRLDSTLEALFAASSSIAKRVTCICANDTFQLLIRRRAGGHIIGWGCFCCDLGSCRSCLFRFGVAAKLKRSVAHSAPRFGVFSQSFFSASSRHAKLWLAPPLSEHVSIAFLFALTCDLLQNKESSNSPPPAYNLPSTTTPCTNT